MSDYFGRADAPFSDAVWEMLDNIVITAAKSRLTGRRLLDIEGPYGVALKSIPLADVVTTSGNSTVAASRSIPVPMIQATFSLNQRDLAALEQTGLPFDASAIANAALTLAESEDSLIFQGMEDLGVPGLTNSPGTRVRKLTAWDESGAAANDIIHAVTEMDEAGFAAPYSLALAPNLYNTLLKLYPGGWRTELDHVNEVVGSKTIKAIGLRSGGILLAGGKHFASIVVGMDMTVGFVGPNNNGFDFTISESLVPRINVPESVSILQV